MQTNTLKTNLALVLLALLALLYYLRYMVLLEGIMWSVVLILSTLAISKI